jgi:hypothetical protein
MKFARAHFCHRGFLFSLCALLCAGISFAQDDDRVEQGQSIGKVSTQGDLIVLELNDGALGKTNLFDLTGRTLHFTPDGSGYRVESGGLLWDSDFGPKLSGSEVTLHQFAFPFSGQSWNSFHVGTTGSIRFGAAEREDNPFGGRPGDGGVSIGRFDPLAEAASTIRAALPQSASFSSPGCPDHIL